LGMLVGLLLITLGCAVLYFGSVGELARITELLDIDNGDIDTLAGAVFCLFGFTIMWTTRYRV